VGAHGGLAISVRSVPRFTKDLDFAVAVVGDPEAEDVVHRLGGRGYRPVEVLEQDYVERLSLGALISRMVSGARPGFVSRPARRACRIAPEKLIR
jgi:hypothetical protein